MGILQEIRIKYKNRLQNYNVDNNIFYIKAIEKK